MRYRLYKNKKILTSLKHHQHSKTFCRNQHFFKHFHRGSSLNNFLYVLFTILIRVRKISLTTIENIKNS